MTEPELQIVETEAEKRERSFAEWIVAIDEKIDRLLREKEDRPIRKRA